MDDQFHGQVPKEIAGVPCEGNRTRERGCDAFIAVAMMISERIHRTPRVRQRREHWMECQIDEREGARENKGPYTSQIKIRRKGPVGVERSVGMVRTQRETPHRPELEEQK